MNNASAMGRMVQRLQHGPVTRDRTPATAPN